MVDVHATMTTAHLGNSPAPIEPLLEVDEIQGNIFPGFMKPRMAVMALTIGDAVSARKWLAGLVPR